LQCFLSFGKIKVAATQYCVVLFFTFIPPNEIVLWKK